MTDFTNWARKDFGDPAGAPKHRSKSMQETNADLQKPIQQLICDAHEEIHAERSMEINLPLAFKRMVSMMGRVALEHERVGRRIIALTRVLVALTVLLVALTVLLAVLTYWLIRIDNEHAAEIKNNSSRVQHDTKPLETQPK